jgi:hypothetical protein
MVVVVMQTIPHVGKVGAPLHYNTCVGGDEFLESWGVGESKWYCGVMVEATNSFKLQPTSLKYVYKVYLPVAANKAVCKRWECTMLPNFGWV